MEVDLVTVSTPRLRDYISSFTKNVFLLPNYLNDDLWQLRAPAVIPTQDAPVVIGYMGGPSHKPDLDMILPVLLRLTIVIQKSYNLTSGEFDHPPNSPCYLKYAGITPIRVDIPILQLTFKRRQLIFSSARYVITYSTPARVQ